MHKNALRFEFGYKEFGPGLGFQKRLCPETGKAKTP